MNRKKKINATLKKHQKRANAKLHTSNKPKYVSKADRAALELAKEEQAKALEVQVVNETQETVES